LIGISRGGSGAPAQFQAIDPHLGRRRIDHRSM